MMRTIKRILMTNPTQDAQRAMQLRKKLSMVRSRLARKYYILCYNRILCRHNSEIPLTAVVPPDTTFPHGLNGILISKGGGIGHGCTIFQQVTIGSNTLADSAGYGAPVVGNNVYIGAGAKIIGNVKVGNNVRIGANAVVVTDVPDNATVVCERSKMILHETPRDNSFTIFQLEED